MSIFDQITYEQALRLLAMSGTNPMSLTPALPSSAPRPGTSAVELSPPKTSSLKYFNEDHWQGGAGWIGPQPRDDADNAAKVKAEIRRNFISHNAVKDVVVRHRDGVLGSEPQWDLTPRRGLAKKGDLVDGRKIAEDEQPNEVEQALIQEAVAALIDWWDRRAVLNKFQDAVVRMLCERRGYLRLFVPLVETDSEGKDFIPEGPLSESLERIFIDTPEPEQAAIYVDPETQLRLGIYSYTSFDFVKNTQKQIVELTYLDDNDETVVRRLEPNSQSAEDKQNDPLKLDEYLPLIELKGEALITEQVRSNQALLNMALTMMGRNVVQGGFLERTILNAQMPGKWVDDPDNPGKKIFQPNPVGFGAGRTNVFQGIAWTETEGGVQKVRLANPSVVYRDPVDPKTFIETAQDAYGYILKETHQTHLQIAGDGKSSGEARKQARDDYEKSLKKTKSVIDAAGRALIETVLAMAAQFSGRPGKFESLRATFDCRLDAGPLSADDRQAIIAEVASDLRPREDAMSLLGADDPDAWVEKIASEKARLNPQPIMPPTTRPGVKTTGEKTGQEGIS